MKPYIIIAFECIEYSAALLCLIRCVFLTLKSYFIYNVVAEYTQGGILLREYLQIHVSAKENITQQDSMIIKSLSVKVTLLS